MNVYPYIFLLITLSSFFLSLLLVPLIIIRLPSDYFAREYRQPAFSLTTLLFAFGKNILGAIFILAGIVMLFLPGQGILTICVGIFLMDFPYKYQLEKRLIRQPKILASFNWLRKKSKQEPFHLKES